ncbi:hypothetical protein H257_15875 [Aphanomyces astaci]|uniref:SCD domain-containing protein n=1 Tax=Aphanomyces astaci TaxID=112090 RepID=W4FKZ8_APHAT|nr:hypothetical protein H257_15875 [Aphanomyces astaci]ETV68145.1 hypothetical protein H257_15875 [Aphanomyces astaci]|eukprot:XP_009842444.1 hypothetical protein H257_15875 [Aphanomyces astaci]
MPRRDPKKPSDDAKSVDDDEVEGIDDTQEDQVTASAASSEGLNATEDDGNGAPNSTEGDAPKVASDDESGSKTPPAKTMRRAKGKRPASTPANESDNEHDVEQEKATPGAEVEEGNESTPAPAVPQRRSARAHNPTPLYTSPSVAASKRDAESPADTSSQSKTPSGRPPRPTKRTLSVHAGKPQPQSKKTVKQVDTEANDDDDEGEFMLYEAVKSGSANMATLVREWRSRFEASADAASRELINFIMNACGSTSICVEEQDDLDELDLMSFVDTVVVSLQASNQLVYPLASKVKGFRKFKDSFATFWGQWIEECWDSDLIHNTDIVEKVVDWLNSLSSSEVRAIRHTTTFAAYAIGNALVARARQLTDQLVPINRQCAAVADTSKTPKSSKKNNPKLARLLELKGTYDEQLANTQTYLTSLFNGVVVHRYRDTMPELRLESVQTLGHWIHTLPEEFLVDNYLKFLGWMLNDKSAKVRVAVVNALQTIYSHEDNADKLALFTSRFMRRYLEMCDDVDDDVVLSIVELIAKIDRLNLLDGESDLTVVERLVFDADSRIRRSAAEFVCLQYDAFGVTDDDMTEAQLIVQAVALVEFAEEYNDKDNDDSIDWLVSAFWDNEDCQVLSNWRLLTVLLGSDTHEPSLSSHQQTLLIRLLTGVVKQLVAAGATSKKPRQKRGDDSEPMTVFFCREIPTLMLRFQSEPAKLCLLLQLVSTLDWDDATIMNQHKKHVEDLLGRLKHAYSTHSDERFLEELSRCIHGLTASKTALTRQAAVLEQELMRDAIDHTTALLAQDTKTKDSEFALQAWLARLHFLSGYINVKDVEVVGNVPAALVALVTERTNLLDVAGPRLSSSCVRYAAHILFKEFLWSSVPLFDAIEDVSSPVDDALTTAMDAFVKRRDVLDVLLFRLLSVHLSEPVTPFTDHVLDTPELELTDDQIPYVNGLHETAFLLLSDLRCLCAQRFEAAVAPFNRLAYQPHKNLLMLSQAYYERIMEQEDDGNDGVRDRVVVALACTSLCNPQNKRQAASVLQQMTSDAFQPLVKAFGKRLMGVSVVKYLEIQMLSLQQSFEEASSPTATVDLAKVLNQSLGTKVPASVRGSLLKFMSEGLRYGLETPENGSFLAALKPYLARLDKAGTKALHGHFVKLFAAKQGGDDEDIRLDPAVADMEALLSGEKDLVVAPPKPAATLKRARDNLSDDEGTSPRWTTTTRRSRNLSDDEADENDPRGTPPPQSFGRQQSPKARKPRAAAKPTSAAKEKDTQAFSNKAHAAATPTPSKKESDDDSDNDAAAQPSKQPTKTPPSKTASGKKSHVTPTRRSTRSKVVVDLNYGEDSDEEPSRSARDEQEEESSPSRKRKPIDESATATTSKDEDDIAQGDDDDEVVGFRPKRRRQ